MRLLCLLLQIATLSSFHFDEPTAIRNLQIAASTYCDQTSIDGLEIISEIREETNVIVANDVVQDALVFSFRGSSDIANWISNIEAEYTAPYPDQSIKVHRGLYAEYMKYKERVFSHLDPTRNVVISGHSSGGALSMFFAYDIHLHLRTFKTPPSGAVMSDEDDADWAFSMPNGVNYNVSVYTYGKPRIGNDNFAESAKNINHYRITHGDDIVPHLPEELFGYRHTGTEIWYYGDDDKHTICTEKEDPNCSNSCAPTHCTSTNDHMYYMMTNIGSAYCSRRT